MPLSKTEQKRLKQRLERISKKPLIYSYSWTAQERFQLTGQQLMVLFYFAEGFLVKEIAAEMDISEQAVHQHTAAMKKKLGARSTSNAVAIYAYAAREDAGPTILSHDPGGAVIVKRTFCEKTLVALKRYYRYACDPVTYFRKFKQGLPEGTISEVISFHARVIWTCVCIDVKQTVFERSSPRKAKQSETFECDDANSVTSSDRDG